MHGETLKLSYRFWFKIL